MIYIRVLKTLVRYLAAKDTATSTNRRGEADSPMFDSSSHAMVNCAGFSPALASFNRWKELGRHMKRGEKAAITLCMPITVKHETVKFVDGTEKTEERPMQIFGFKNNSFVLAQADRQAFQPPVVPEWERDPPSITLDQIRRFPIFLTCYVIPTRPR